MKTPNLPAVRPKRLAWNKGRIVGQKRPLLPKHVWAIRVRLEIAEVADVYLAGNMKERAYVLQSKTQKPVRFEITEGTRKSVAKWLDDPLMIGSKFLWPDRFHDRFRISIR